MRKKYNLNKFKMQSASEYINMIKFNVDVGHIYKICDSCNYNVDNDFCPIIVKLGDQMKNINNDNTMKT